MSNKESMEVIKFLIMILYHEQNCIYLYSLSIQTDPQSFSYVATLSKAMLCLTEFFGIDRTLQIVCFIFLQEEHSGSHSSRHDTGSASSRGQRSRGRQKYTRRRERQRSRSSLSRSRSPSRSRSRSRSRHRDSRYDGKIQNTCF